MCETARRGLIVLRSFSYSAMIMFYGAGLMWLGFARRSALLRWQAILLIAATVIKVFLVRCLGTRSRLARPQLHYPGRAAAGGLLCLPARLDWLATSALRLKCDRQRPESARGRLSRTPPVRPIQHPPASKPSMSPRSLRLLAIFAIGLLPRFCCFLIRHDSRAAAPASSVFSDYRSQSPGQSHHITLQDLPQPYATPSADHVVAGDCNVRRTHGPRCRRDFQCSSTPSDSIIPG